MGTAIDFFHQIGVMEINPTRVDEFLSIYKDEIKDDIQKLWDQYEEQEKSDNEQTDNNMMIIGSGLPDDKARQKAHDEAKVAQIKGRHITLPNGKVNEEYNAKLDFEDELSDIADINFEDLETIGLQYNDETREITGIPNTAGDHKVIMQCKFKDWKEGHPERIPKEITIIVNPDPRELWSRSIPTPDDIEYYKPDNDKLFVKVEAIAKKRLLKKKTIIPRKDMAAASQRGRSHAISGKPRDDDFALRFDNETGWYIMVVADGAGSAEFSREGSHIACKTAIESCQKNIAQEERKLESELTAYNGDKDNAGLRKEVYQISYNIVAAAAFEAYRNIEKEAKDKDRHLKSYSTTLLLTICKHFDFGWYIAAFWVGDGGIGIYQKEQNNIILLGEPDSGEFAGQTRFLTMKEIFSDRQRTRFEIVDDFTAVVLMSDGITDPKFETDANLKSIEKWHALWNDLRGNNEDNAKVDFTDNNEQSADQLLKWLNFWSKGNHDDRTIAILY
jgi:serine/threonine protein phosphatase PrpC